MLLIQSIKTFFKYVGYHVDSFSLWNDKVCKAICLRWADWHRIEKQETIEQCRNCTDQSGLHMSISSMISEIKNKKCRFTYTCCWYQHSVSLTCVRPFSSHPMHGTILRHYMCVWVQMCVITASASLASCDLLYTVCTGIGVLSFQVRGRLTKSQTCHRWFDSSVYKKTAFPLFLCKHTSVFSQTGAGGQDPPWRPL